MIKFYTFLGVCGLLLFSIRAQGQPATTDSTNSTNDEAHIAAYYHQLIGESSGLFSGIEYKYPAMRITGSPFYLTDDWTNGSIIYNHVLYPNVLIKYEQVHDQLVSLLANGVLPYILNTEKVEQFNLLNHHFIYVLADSLQKKEISSGFYEKLYGGKTEVLVKREKTIETSNGIGAIESKYIDNIKYYIKSKEVYYNVSGNGSVVDALKDRKKEVQQFIKSKHIKAQRNPEINLVQIATYYDTITK